MVPRNLESLKQIACALTVGVFLATGSASVAIAGKDEGAPKILLNGVPGDVTVQDLSGFGTRPLRLLVNRNNKARGSGFFRVYALGVREGDELVLDLEARSPGTRATIYKIIREADGRRYLSMPFSEYFPEVSAGLFTERVGPGDEAFLIIVFEKTDSPEEKNVQVRYFEERVRKLAITSFKTNFTLSSLKLRMKDFGGDEVSEFFERDAQLLIDRLQFPEQILLVRLWRKK